MHQEASGRLQTEVFSWLLACALDFQQEMDLEELAVSVLLHPEQLCDLKGHQMSLQCFKSM